MATITGLTAARMLAIEAASVVDGEIVGDDLILTRQGGSTINAGDVRGPVGPAGPTGSDLAVVTAQAILEVGTLDQIKAGRLLTTADFTNMGLSAPTGLYPLSGTPDTSGNGRNLTNKGTVPFTARGIAGGTNSAATFVASTSQALYIADSGAADPFRLRAGTFGCWFRTPLAISGLYQVLISKTTYPSDGQMAYWLEIGPDGRVGANFCPDGLIANKVNALGTTRCADDRWHFAVMQHDGAQAYLYIDGALEANALMPNLIFAGSGPFNIGSSGANAGSAGSLHFAGAIDEAFVTADILSEDQIRNLYCARMFHSLGAVPKRVELSVRRRKKGAALVTADFPSTPLRLYNFSAGALANEGSDANGAAGSTATLANNGTAVAAPGVDGLPGNAYSFAGAQSLSATDTGLPAGTTSWSFGQWFKMSSFAGNPGLGGWGNGAGNNHVLHWVGSPGYLVSRNGADDISTSYLVTDGIWHFVVTTAENAPGDGQKRKCYIDGKLVKTSANLNSISVVGANNLRIGSGPTGGLPFIGQIDSTFICNYVLTCEQINKLYLKGAQALGVSPKNAGDHVEAMSSTDLLVIFDSLEGQHQIDLAVA